jgi:anaerobic ribonucleoside-triphosphate reductase activating protein
VLKGSLAQGREEIILYLLSFKEIEEQMRAYPDREILLSTISEGQIGLLRLLIDFESWRLLLTQDRQTRIQALELAVRAGQLNILRELFMFEELREEAAILGHDLLRMVPLYAYRDMMRELFTIPAIRLDAMIGAPRPFLPRNFLGQRDILDDFLQFPLMEGAFDDPWNEGFFFGGGNHRNLMIEGILREQAQEEERGRNLQINNDRQSTHKQQIHTSVEKALSFLKEDYAGLGEEGISLKHNLTNYLNSFTFKNEDDRDSFLRMIFESYHLQSRSERLIQSEKYFNFFKQKVRLFISEGWTEGTELFGKLCHSYSMKGAENTCAFSVIGWFAGPIYDRALEENYSSEIYREGVTRERVLENLFLAFYECQRGGNFDSERDKGVFWRGRDVYADQDEPICAGGIMHKLIEKISFLLQGVTLDYSHHLVLLQKLVGLLKKDLLEAVLGSLSFDDLQERVMESYRESLEKFKREEQLRSPCAYMLTLRDITIDFRGRYPEDFFVQEILMLPSRYLHPLYKMSVLLRSLKSADLLTIETWLKTKQARSADSLLILQVQECLKELDDLQEQEDILELLMLLYTLNLSKGVILFTGYSIDEINKDFLLRKSLSYIDVLIDGRYEKDKRISSGLRGSENQNILYFSDKIHPDELMIDQEIEVGVSCDKIYIIS